MGRALELKGEASQDALRREPEPIPHLSPNAPGVAQRRLHPARRGPQTRIAILDGIPAERHRTAPQRCERAVMRQEQVKKLLKVVRFWHRDGPLLEEGLEILLRRLLAV